MFNKQFFISLGERALGAAIAVVIARLGGGDILDISALAQDWPTTLKLAGGAAAGAVLWSVVAALLPAGGTGNPTLAYPPNLPVLRRDAERR